MSDSIDDRIVEFIRMRAAEQGFPPTLREIGAEVGVSSTGALHRRLQGLQAAGRVTYVPGRVRTLRVVEQEVVDG